MGERRPTPHRRRLAWFTPFTRASAIGVCSQKIVERLREQLDVEVWFPDLGETLPSSAPLRPFPPENGAAPEELDDYDYLVYNLGNHYRYHGGIWETHKKKPGIIILHDLVMYHFFAEMLLDQRNDPDAFVELFRRLYGAGAADRVSRSLRGVERPISESSQVAEWPLFEETVRRAHGVVTHSRFFEERIRDVADCPHCRLDLPSERSTQFEPIPRKRLHLRDDDVLIVVAGYLNQNKRPESIIRALGAIRPSDSVKLALVGAISEGESARLLQIAGALGIDRSVRLTGYATEEEFYSYLHHADICVNLRYPNTEGASASAIEQMLFGSALIALDTGFFHELPDQVVARVRLKYEQEDLQRVLRELIESPDRRRELAFRARTYAESRFRADLYAWGFRDFLSQVDRARPALRLADAVSRILGEIRCKSDNPIVDLAAREIDQTFLTTPAIDDRAQFP
jgi:glycosyltransferase involved in cell wall biosynthesis